MNGRTIPLDYANSLVYELEKAFWDERGRGARFRMTTVGREYFEAKCLPLIQSSELDSIVHTVEEFLQQEGIAGKVVYSREDRLLRVRVEGCVHRQVEDSMAARGIEPFTCVPANLIVLAIEEKLDRPVELAEIKLEDGVCQLLLVVFDQRPALV
jgi:hypothetical protein